MKTKMWGKIKKQISVIMIALLTIIMLPPVALADSAGPRSGSTFGFDWYGSASWASPQNAVASDNVYTTALANSSIQTTAYFKASGFGFNIPANATINGVTVGLERSQTGTGTSFYDEVAMLIKNNTPVYQSGYNRSTGAYWGSTDAIVTYGSATDVWGQTLTPADVNSAGFGFAVAARKISGTKTARIDHVSMTVYYTIADSIPPVISTHDPVVAEATSASGAIVNYVAPTATDNIDPSVTVNCSPAPGSGFPLGNTTVTCNASDVAGNVATPVDFNVLVQDTTAPVITLNGASTINFEYGSNYTEEGASWTDAVDGTGAATVSGDVVNTSALGSYTIRYNYTDAAGNVANEVTRVVNVVDSTKPIVTLNGASEMDLEVNTNYSETGAGWSDNVDGTGNVTDITGSVNANVIGDYVIRYNFTDSSGNAAEEVTRTIHVKDTIKPIINLIGDIIINHEVKTPYTDPGATASDNHDGDLTSAINAVNSVISDVLGDYTVTYNVVDSSGNAAETVTRTVHIVDTTKPVITLNGASSVYVEQGSNYQEQGATWSDNYDGNGNVTDISGAVNTNVPGYYWVKYNFTDSSGNIANEVARTIRVGDTTAPSVISISPANGARNVSRNSNIIVTLSEPLDPTTVNAKNIILKNSWGRVVKGKIYYDQNKNQIIFNPNGNLWPWERYQITISKLKDLNGNIMLTKYNSTFRTSWR